MSVIQFNNLATQASSAAKEPHIWAVGSGKGGVGKSFIAANLGMALAKHGKKTVMVDLDLGGANLHTCLGIPNPQTTLSDFINHKGGNINDLIGHHGDARIGLISGASDSLQIANLKHFQKMKIIRNLSMIDADYVILDLGAGTTFNTLDFFLHADRGLLTVVPEPTSIENTYRFLKCLLTRKLKDLPKQTRKLMDKVLTLRREEGGKMRTLASFLAAMEQLHPDHGRVLRGELNSLNLNLIVNQVLEPGDTELGSSMEMICNKYFGVNVPCLGYLNHDIHVIKALRQRKPFLPTFPQSRNAICLDHIAASLMEADIQQTIRAQARAR